LSAKFNDWKSKSDMATYSGGGAVALASTPPMGGGGAVGSEKATEAADARARTDLNNILNEWL
jgi:hypothetical protein